MDQDQAVAIGHKVRVEGGIWENLFRGRDATLVGYTRGWGMVRLDDAGPWEAAISAEQDDSTGLPIVLVVPECLRGVS